MSNAGAEIMHKDGQNLHNAIAKMLNRKLCRKMKGRRYRTAILTHSISHHPSCVSVLYPRVSDAPYLGYA